MLLPSPRLMYIAAIVLIFHIQTGESNDARCSCKCPETYWVDPSIETDYPERKIYIRPLESSKDCDCEHVVQPVLNLTQEQVDKMCPRCRCKHEERSTTTIKVVVIIVLWVLSVLVVYLLYLVCLDPLIKGKPIQVRGVRSDLPYQQQQDNDSLDNDSSAGDSTPMRSVNGGGVVNRLGREQDRWMRAVENQRSSVYTRHSLLN